MTVIKIRSHADLDNELIFFFATIIWSDLEPWLDHKPAFDTIQCKFTKTIQNLKMYAILFENEI